MENILNPEYWRERLEKAKTANQIHHAIFQCDFKRWVAMEENHKKILNKLISPLDTILDVGCGWGRILEILPEDFNGVYNGVDLSPDFIKLAQERKNYLKCKDKTKILFSCVQIIDFLRNPNRLIKTFDWAILISFKQMIIRNCGADNWNEIHNELKTQCKKILYLEYDLNDKGTIEYGN